MDIWTFLWLMLALKIPIVALFLLVRWAVRQTPEPATGDDGGIGRPSAPRHPHRPHPHTGPRLPRRGPHGEPSPPSPQRVRTHAPRRRVTRS